MIGTDEWTQWEEDEAILFLRGTDEDRAAIREDRWARQVPARFADATFAQVDPAVRETLRRWIDGSSPRPNLVLVGPVGVGKTHAALAVAREIHYRDEKCAFYPVVELLDDLRPDGDNRLERRFQGADAVVLDDVGGERSTEWAVEQMYRLVNRRWLDRKPIIATTNIAPGKLSAISGERILSRLMGGAVVVELSGQDRRY